MRKLRIVHSESSCGWGGQEIRILTESMEMMRRGHEVQILAVPDSNILNEARKLNIPVQALPIKKKNLRGLFSVLFWLGKNKKNVDVINTHSSTDSWLIALSKKILRLNIPIIRTRHVSTPISNNFFSQLLYRKWTNFIVTTGDKLRQQLINDNFIDQQKIMSVRTGIDLKRYCPKNQMEIRRKLEQPNLRTIGIVATLRSWKGHAFLIEAWSKIPQIVKKEWRLLIVGDGPQMSRLLEQAQKVDGDRIDFVGNQYNVEDWLNCFDIFVLPSYGNEGVPQGIMQAMATGLPIVTTEVGAITEIVDDSNGIFVKPKDSDDLAQKLQLLMENEKLRHLKGSASLRKSSSLSVCSMGDEMEKIFLNSL